ncbi:MAG TPA: hypothetical protein VLF91_01365 [Candidatus Saccharimonadales bacterium]|nr:hypothetical protein [Candidatus Saccharimonadales bacterium]
MREQKWTPTDLLTGLPLLIAPDPDLPLGAKGPRKVAPDIADVNHGVHPRLDPTLVADPSSRTPDAGPAYRESRGQFLLRPTHERYHREFYGPRLITGALGQFVFCTLAASNYIPEEGLDLSGSSAKIITFSHAQRERLRTSGEVYVMRPEVVRRFLLQFAMSQSMDSQQISIADELTSLRLNRRKPEQQARLALRLLHGLVEPVVYDGLRDAYRYGRKNSLVRPGLPPSVHSFLHRELIGGQSMTQQAVARIVQQWVALRYSGRMQTT